MTPSEIRILISLEHDLLVSQIASIEAAIERGSAPGSPTLRPFVQKWLLDLARHINDEERLLVPALRESTSWSQREDHELSVHHAAQLKEIASVQARLTEGPDSLSAAVLAAFMSEIRADIETENALLRVPTVLSDEPYSDGVGG